MRIALIHAVRVAIDPVEQAFERLWPDAIRMNLLDDRLSGDLAETGDLTPEISRRIADLADYAVRAGAAGVLYTCSAFGPAIEAVQYRFSCPVLKPNEAMFAEAAQGRGSIGLLASFEPSLAPMQAEFEAMTGGSKASMTLACAPDAMSALNAGDGEAHDQILADAAAALGACDTILLAQFSTARARDAVQRATGKPVLTSPDSAVSRMRSLLEGGREHRGS